MKQQLSSLLTKRNFIQTKDINQIPDSKGIYFIADCPLTETDPSKWLCTPIKKGASDRLKSTISSYIKTDGLAQEYKSLTYFFVVDLSLDKYKDILAEIESIHI